MQGTAAVGSVLARRLPGERAMVVGALVFAVGVAGTVGSLLTGSVAVFFGAAVVSGLGFGAAFLGAMATVTRGVAPGERAGLLSSVFVVGYLAYSIPAIAGRVRRRARSACRPPAEVYGAVVDRAGAGHRDRPADPAAGRRTGRGPGRSARPGPRRLSRQLDG